MKLVIFHRTCGPLMQNSPSSRAEATVPSGLSTLAEVLATKFPTEANSFFILGATATAGLVSVRP